jgi:hypothetical protein
VTKSPREKAPPKPTFERREHVTGFTAILDRLLSATPGSIGATIVDAEGEAVDYAGATIDPFEIKVAAAHLRILLQEIDTSKIAARSGPTQRLTLLTTKRLFVLDTLPDGYALLSILERDAAFGHADRALDLALHDLYLEAGWSAQPGFHRWHPVEVQTENGRPRSIKVDGGVQDVVVIGKVVAGLQRGEHGFRVAIGKGDIELTLVRGRDDRWYADGPVG